MSSDKKKGGMTAIRNVFLNSTGRLRAAWQLAIIWIGWLLLALSGAFAVSRLLLSSFSAWGVNNATISYAPGWVQYLAAYQLPLMGAAAAFIAAAAAAAAMRCYRSRGNTSPLTVATAFSGGALIPLIMLGLFVAADSMRLQSAIPVFRIDMLLILAFSLLTAAAEGFVAFGYVRNMMLEHANPIAAHIITALTFFIMNAAGATSVLHGINLLLIGLALSLMAERHGYASCIALRTGWLWSVSALAGFPGNTQGMLSLYPVSENLLTGGFNGPETGLIVTIIAAAIIIPTFAIPIFAKHKSK